MLLSFPNVSPFIPPFTLHLPTLQHSPLPQFMSMGCTYKFFESSVSYNIFYLSPSILCLLIMILPPCTFPPIPPFPEIPPCDVHFSDSVPVLVVCLAFVFIVFLFFQVHLLIVVHLLFYCSYFLSSFSQISPFNISYNKGLMMMKSFNLTLSGKYFICPSILNENGEFFAGQSNLGCWSSPFMTSNASFQPLLAYKVSFEKSAHSLMGSHLWVTVSFCCF